MNWAGAVYLLITVGLFAIFVAIVVWTYSGKRKKSLELPRERMLEPDEPGQSEQAAEAGEAGESAQAGEKSHKPTSP